MTIPFMRPITFAEQKFYTYQINQSARFNDDDSAYLYWASGTNAVTKKTFSIRVKRCNLDTNQGIFDTYISASAFEMMYFNTSNKLCWVYYNGGTYTNYVSTQLFRDVGSWYHLVFVQDTTQATATNRIKIYCNGDEITAWDTQISSLAQDSTHSVILNSTSQTRLGLYTDVSGYGDFYLAEAQAVTGQALTPADFGQSKYGIWIPKKYTGTYGNNGFYLDFADSANLGNDVSGNDNDFTSSGLTSNDQVEDTPTNNWCTLNSSRLGGYQSFNGNLDFRTTPSTLETWVGTIAVDSGKWYWEVTPTNVGAGFFFGINDEWLDDYGLTGYGQTKSVHYYHLNGNKYIDNVSTAYGDSFTINDVMAIALDLDSAQNTITFYKNNVSQGTINIDSGYTWFPTFTDGSSSNDVYGSVDFGQLGFTYTPPAGYKALNSKNISNPTVKDSSTGFDVVLWTGDATIRDITDLSFQPNLVWIKNRDAVDEHKLIDSIRGATKELSSDSTAIESTDANGLTAFLPNGFSLGTGANGYNDNAESFVAWCFRMGSKYGFDIQTYEGTGVAHAENHNLEGIPELMIIKNITNAYDWAVYHHHALTKTDPETDRGYLNLTNAWADINTIWNDTAPTTTQFTVGTHTNSNNNSQNYVAYLWRSIPQFSKVFSYIGNGIVDGPFVWCGFKPRYILLKRAVGGVGDWNIHDTERSTYNPVEKSMQANLTAVEVDVTTKAIDIVSNGFKLKSTNAYWNWNTHTYVGIAYAEQPFKYSNSF